jgi:hypothetical protein
VQITINVPDQLATQAHARGMALEAYAEELLSEQVQSDVPSDFKSIESAIDRIVELRQGNRLNGISIRELIDEGRKY